MDSHALGCSEHNLTISGKCLSVCMGQKFCGKCSSKTAQQNLMKFYISCEPNINWCLSTFRGNRSIDGAVVSFFPKFLGYADLGF